MSTLVSISYAQSASYNGTALNSTTAVTSDFLYQYQIAYAASTTNSQLAIAFDYTKIQAFYALSVGDDCTLKFNSTGSPAPSITIKNGVPYQWLLASGVTNPFAANVTTMYVSTTAGCTLYLLFQVNK
jgi:hypothetical protein